MCVSSVLLDECSDRSGASLRCQCLTAIGGEADIVLDPRAGRVARREGGMGKRAVTELERKHLVETDRHIAECKEYIAKQRERIERAIQEGRSDHAGRI